MTDETLDLAIIGGGPAGCTASIYATRYKLKHAMIADEFGGLMLNADVVENYPGFASIKGKELMGNFKAHLEALGGTAVQGRVESVAKRGRDFAVTTGTRSFLARSIIVATGSERRKLGVKGEEECADGYGVSYCAICDAAFFKNRVTCVVGGSDSAAKEALVLSRVAKKVYVIYRKGKIRAEPAMAERVYTCGNIEVIHNANVKEIVSDDDGMVCKVVLDNGSELETRGVFIDVGFIPRSDLAKGLGVELNDVGEIVVDADCKTNVAGIFAAGDVTSNTLKQAITAAADGARACWAAFQYVQAAGRTAHANPRRAGAHRFIFPGK
ncbi:MAG: FAD-dependent oxidoreductase [Candidatus Lokiarchaeota archaeon]|nr:FAD-dependent oxidoreductase [Candidatus Lokiarchaeota archaeon]